MKDKLLNLKILNDKTLAGLFGPLGVNTFFSSVWGKKPAQIETGEDFSHLLCAADVDHLLRYADAGFRVTRYTDGESDNCDIPKIENAPDLYAVYEAWDQGYSISIDHLHRFWPALTGLCQHLESLLHFRVAANLYFTPPDDQCFPPHYDGHEVVVLQLEGEKAWKIWDRKPEYTLEDGSPIENPETMPDPVMETTIRAGDVLYVPQGFPHQARTTKGRSLHVTLSIYPVTKKMIMDLIFQAASHLKVNFPDNLPGNINDPAARPKLGNKLPPGFLDRDDLGDDLKKWLNASVRKMLIDEVKIAIRHGLTYRRQPAVTGHFGFLQDINTIHTNTVFRKRNQSLCATGISGDESWFTFHRHRVTGTREMEVMFRFITATEAFRLGELPGKFPEEIKKQVISQLVKQGLLAIEREAASEI